jgi:hypothetical protein
MNKMYIIMSLAAIAIGLGLTACDTASSGKGDPGDGDIPPSYANVYIVGSSTINKPMIWNDGTASALSIPATDKGDALGVAVNASHVYVAGYHGSNFPYTPCVWIDGVRSDLQVANAAVNGEANAIALSGSDVYVAGDAWDATAANGDGAYVPGYWKLSGTSWTWSKLATGDGTAVAVAIDGSGQAVFAGKNIFSGSSAWYWDQSAVIKTLVAPPTVASMSATGIAIKGSSILVVGYYKKSGDFYSHPCVWTDGACSDLTDGSANWAHGIGVSGSDVYVVGECTTGFDYIPGYWKNGTWASLSYEGHYSNTAAIAISGSDIYIAGQNDPLSGISGGFWKNGKRVNIAGVIPVHGIAIR